MAEVETALNALPAASEDAKSAPQVSEAARLLQLSSQAYESDDFVKSIELADQAQQLIDAVASASQDQTAARPPAAKERPFKSAISLRVRVRSNLRVGPTRQSKVVAVLEPDTTVEAHSYQGQWVRVKTRDGQSGWIFRTLLTE